MPQAQQPPGPPSSREDAGLLQEALRARIEALEQDKRDLEVMLDTSTQHADLLSAELEQERNDLATMLEMTTLHADTVEDELHENAAAALVKNARQLRLIVEATPAPVLISRLSDGQIVFANAMASTLFQAAPQVLLTLKVAELYLDPADRAPILETLQSGSGVDHQELRFKRLDGTVVWVEASLRQLEFNNDPCILSALHDITERKEAEQRLQQQVDELRQELDDTSRSSELARNTGTTRFSNLDAVVLDHGSTRLIALHSFRGGNGKSSIAVNLAALLADSGKRVAVVDADLQAPGLHVLFGQAVKNIKHTLNDVLLGNCDVQQLAIDVTGDLGQPVSGRVFLVPASVNPGTMAQVLSQGYEAQRLTQTLHELSKTLQLDVLLIDTHSGMNEEALLIMRAVQTVVVVMRTDAQDLEGTGVTVQVARQLEVPNILLMINQLPASGQLHAVRGTVEETFRSEVVATLPHAVEFMNFDHDGLFVFRHPGHPISLALLHASSRLLGLTLQGQTVQSSGAAT